MRTESIEFQSFMSGEYKSKKRLHPKWITVAKGSIAIPIISSLNGSFAFAATQDTVAPVVASTTKESIIHAFDPLIDLMISVALPIAGIMITGGALMIMLGQKDKGFMLIMNASLGYVLVNLSPLLLSLLESVGKAI
ncbi:hypothetical protein OEV98_10855 [Caldibacillus lycopersici]|uniref:TrbC/VirB2 family protein n=1 Tax=Perspicuibacillus lycopersici TaxID=1325689 RepID=A0AAE3IUY6_9BACI|nr:hypothetical protein [Perspicuibacillus lycopersici]MCU9614058.1 hypothetical protein [Perspicuibacillus lycopersici]